MDDGGGNGDGKANRMIQDRREVGVAGDAVAGGVIHDKMEAAKSPGVRVCITSDTVRANGRHTGGFDSSKLVSPHRGVSSRR